MRIVTLAGLAAAGLLAGCADTATQVSSTAPTVSYRVVGNDLSQANADAGRYCARYNMGAQLTGVQPSGNGSIAYYSCGGGTVGSTTYPYGSSPYGTAYPSSYSYPTYPTYGSTAPVYTAPGYTTSTTVECADWLHQSRPGGTNYSGPPVPGC